MIQHELTKEEVPKFVLAGNATVTLQSGTTGRHFTYRIKKYNDQDVYFVRVLRGPNNEEDYTYIGAYYPQRKRFHIAKAWYGMSEDYWPPAARAITFLFNHLYDKPERLKVFHEGKCGRCGRTLTTPESIKLGYGPECINLVRGD